MRTESKPDAHAAGRRAKHGNIGTRQLGQAKRNVMVQQFRQPGYNHIHQRARTTGALAGKILNIQTSDPTFPRAARLQQRWQPWLAQQMLHTHLFHRICNKARPMETPLCRMCFLFLHLRRGLLATAGRLYIQNEGLSELFREQRKNPGRNSATTSPQPSPASHDFGRRSRSADRQFSAAHLQGRTEKPRLSGAALGRSARQQRPRRPDLSSLRRRCAAPAPRAHQRACAVY